MRKTSKMFAACAALTVMLTGCGSATSQESAEYTVGMVTNTTGVNDESFNQSAWEGLTTLKDDYGFNISYLESVQEADFTSNLDKMHDAGNDLIWGVGYPMADAIYQAAQTNPSQYYGIIDNSYEEVPENVVCMMFRAQEPSFLAGYVAGKTTETDKVGFVGGIASAIGDQFEYGYRAGVAYAAEELGRDIEVNIQYAESFSDAAKGKAIATKMYGNGCDIIFHAAGNAGNGVIEAAKDTGNLVIGVDRDQSDLAPENVLTSALKRVDKAIALVCIDASEEEAIFGQTLEYGLADGAVGLPEENPNMDPAVYEAAMEVQQEIIDGAIEVPYNAETFSEE